MTDKQHFTITEVAEKFSVSYETVRRWIEKGAVSAIRVGPDGAIRIPADQVEQLAREHPSFRTFASFASFTTIRTSRD